MTFTAATDGNHGRAVAWAAKRLRQSAVIYVPKNTAAARIEAIRSEGARVIEIEGTYDDAVKQAAADAKKKGWQVLSDTSYAEYFEIPSWVMSGYTTLFREALLRVSRVECFGVWYGIGAMLPYWPPSIPRRDPRLPT